MNEVELARTVDDFCAAHPVRHRGGEVWFLLPERFSERDVDLIQGELNRRGYVGVKAVRGEIVVGGRRQSGPVSRWDGRRNTC